MCFVIVIYGVLAWGEIYFPILTPVTTAVRSVMYCSDSAMLKIALKPVLSVKAPLNSKSSVTFYKRVFPSCVRSLITNRKILFDIDTNRNLQSCTYTRMYRLWHPTARVSGEAGGAVAAERLRQLDTRAGVCAWRRLSHTEILLV